MLAVTRAASEADLVAKARRGDRNAYGELIRCHHQHVMSVVYRMCADIQLAEDATQEAFLQAWLHLDSFRPGSSLRNWLYRIAVNAALDALRRVRRQVTTPLEADLIADQQPDPETELLQKEQSRLVQQAIMEITETSRAVLVLREYGGLSYQEIASVLGIPVGTVMSRLNSARGRLRVLLEPQLVTMENEHD